MRDRDAAHISGKGRWRQQKLLREAEERAVRCDVGVTKFRLGSAAKENASQPSRGRRQTNKSCRFISLLTPILTHYIKQYWAAMFFWPDESELGITPAAREKYKCHGAQEPGGPCGNARCHQSLGKQPMRNSFFPPIDLMPNIKGPTLIAVFRS